MLLGATVVLFACLKLQIMLTRDDTVTTVTRRDGFYSSEDRLSLSNSEFAMAFGIQSWRHRTHLDDSRFIKWTLRYTVEIDHVKAEKWYPLHRCKEEDFEAFY